MVVQFDRFKDVTPTPQQRTDAIRQLEPKELKDELRSVLEDNVRAGVLGREQLRTAGRNYVKKKVNERLLLRAIPKKKKSLGGLGKNFAGDATEIIDGIGALLGMTANAAHAPFKDALSTPLMLAGQDKVPFTDIELRNDRTVKGIKKASDATTKLITSPGYRSEVYQMLVKPMIEHYKEYRNPGEKLYNDPLYAILDASAILSGGSALLGKGAQISGTASRAASTAGRTGRAAALEKTASILETGSVALDKAQILKWRNLSATTKKVFENMPGGKELLTGWAQAADARKILNKEQTSFLVARNKILTNLDKKIEALTPEEAAILPKVVEGFSQVPDGVSNNFHEALGMVKALADDQARFGLTTGALTSEIIERRKFQPLNNFLEKADSAEGVAFREMVDTTSPYIDLTGQELRGRIDTIKRFFPDADPIYMRHFFDDTPKKFSSFFLNTMPVRTFKPGFLKKSYGKEGYIGSASVTKEQLRDVLAQQATENLKWQRNMGLIEQLKNHPLTKPIKPGEKPLPGHKIFSPDGLLRFYRGTFDLQDELRKSLNKFDNASFEDVFGDVAENVFKKRNYIGVTKAKVYQVPDAMADELQKMTAATNPYFKLFWDKPLDFFRFFALSLSPRWNYNNIVGNMLFSTIGGDVLNPKAFYLYKQAKQKDLLPDELFAGLHRTERTTSGRLGQAAEIPLVKSSIMLHDALLDSRVVGPIVRNFEKTVNWGVVKPLTKLGNFSFRVNEAVDDMFKGVAFINRALINERKGLIRRMATNVDDTLAILEKTKLDDVAREKVINSVHDWYYHGLNLTNLERRVLRRAMPFYSWMRWATLYSYRITTETPIRANIIANMARDYYTFTGQNKLPPTLAGSVPIGTDEDGTVYYLQTRGMNIFGHLADLMSGDGLLGGVQRTLLQSSSPHIKTFVEQATGRDVFLDRPFTRKDVETTIGQGSVWRFDPETGEHKEVKGANRPAVIENLLRNFLPQYLLLETVLAGGQKRYTAEGLDEILKDLFREPGERKAIVEDVITRQGTDNPKWGLELYKSLGINIKDVTAEDRVWREKAQQAASSALKNKMFPILNDDFKNNLRKRIMEEVAKGTPMEEIRAKLRGWIIAAVTDLQKLSEPPKQAK